ncbi:flagellar filament capping protein FliD [Ilumatobacter sp.]|uniref:flagellar filament capping protein FliD n=1 Tax=Ilumatobacter sp. TaxID=1967498 RepID=UPI003B52BC93
MNIGGLDANQIVTDLMQIERIPLAALEARKTKAQEASRAIGALRSSMEAFRLTSLKLATSSAFGRHTTSVSDPAAVTATVTSTASVGSLTFTVQQLASNHGLRSSGTVAARNLPVTTQQTIAFSSNTRQLGIASVRAGAGLGAGSHQLSVVQESDPARLTATTAAAAVTTITAANDTVSLQVDGVAVDLTLSAGSYTAAELAAHVDEQLRTQGIAASGSLDSDGRLRIAGTSSGSGATLAVTGGTARTDLGLGLDSASGSDGIIDVDGTRTTVTNATVGGTISVGTGSGSIDLTIGGPLRIGDAITVTAVDVGTGSLEDVAAAITGSRAGVSAAAVRVDASDWRLQLGSTTSGSTGEIAIDATVFDRIGGLVESSAARNAVVTIGEGAGAYDVEASGNTFTDVLAGVSFTAKRTTGSPVTIGVARDDESLAGDMSKLVEAANKLLAEIKVQTRYDVANKTKGALADNSSIRRLADQIRQALGRPVDGVTGILGSDIGIQSTRDGTFTFDRATFLTAMEERPAEVERLLRRGATTPTGVTFTSATERTATGSYAVEITTAAERATSATLFDGGATGASRVGVRVGDATALVEVSAGDSPAVIADRLNESIARAGLDVVAEIDGTGIRVRSGRYGAAGSFELNLDVVGVGTWDALGGVDVAGTIDGVVATGSGRTLSVPPGSAGRAAGLSVKVDAGLIGALGTIDYQPGIAGRIAEFATAATDVDRGVLQTATTSADRRVEDFNDQIERFEDRLFIKEANMRRQFAALSTLLEGLQTQGNWISGQLSSLPQVSRSAS